MISKEEKKEREKSYRGGTRKYGQHGKHPSEFNDHRSTQRFVHRFENILNDGDDGSDEASMIMAYLQGIEGVDESKEQRRWSKSFDYGRVPLV
jgi:hypothetical protein